MLYVSWLGDSQVMLVRRGQAVELMKPHKPDREVRMVWNAEHTVLWSQTEESYCRRPLITISSTFLSKALSVSIRYTLALVAAGIGKPIVAIPGGNPLQR